MANLPEKYKAELLALKPEDITAKLMRHYFAEYAITDANGKVTTKAPLIKPTDEFVLKKGEYINKTTVTTTAGRFIYNKLVVERLIAGFGDYLNVTLTDDEVGHVDDIMSDALLNDRITTDQFIQYINLQQWLGLTFTSMLCNSITKEVITPNKKVIALRDKLYKENKEAIENGDAIAAQKIEQQCVDLAKKELGNNPGTLLYKSGSRGSFGNNYKNISITKGPIFNPVTGKYDIMKNNFIEGIDKKDIAACANSVVSGAYPKAIGQRSFGYFTKKITAMMQSVVLDKGKDCHSKRTLKVHLTEANINLFKYRWIIENGKYKLLDDNNISSYIGKDVNMRSPMFCSDKKGMCSICAGQMYEKLGIDNAGLTSSKVSSTMSNKSMKLFHDATVHVYRLDKFDLTI